MRNFLSVGEIKPTKLFGNIELIKKIHGTGLWKVKFINTGTIANVSGGDINRGNVRDYNAKTIYGVACRGYGEFKSKVNGRDTDAYKCWNHMLSRCYNSKDKSYKRYGGRGVLVCDEWLVYQNFASWYEDNYPTDGKKYQLDKDIKIDGNKLYSPDACMFATPAENSIKALAKSCRLISPDGALHDVYNISDFCLKNGLLNSGISLVINGKRKSHKGWTLGA